MTIGKALQNVAKNLPALGSSPYLDIHILLAYVLKKDRAFLYTYPEKSITQAQLKSFQRLVAKRKQGWPIAYLTGHKEFFGLDFLVTKDVLVPRPRTELLVEQAIALLRGKKNLKILDVGTGSGVIPISLAKKLGSTHKYFANDISIKALALAKRNAKRHRVNVNFFRADLLSGIKQNFNLITANLPYLEKEVDPSTKYEPKSALIAKERGLALYRKLFEQIADLPQPPKYLVIECLGNQRKTLNQMAKKYLKKTKLHIIA